MARREKELHVQLRQQEPACAAKAGRDDDDDAKVAAEVVVGERKEKQGERVRLQDNNVEAAVSSATSVLFSDILKRELQCHLDR